MRYLVISIVLCVSQLAAAVTISLGEIGSQQPQQLPVAEIYGLALGFEYRAPQVNAAATKSEPVVGTAQAYKGLTTASRCMWSGSSVSCGVFSSISIGTEMEAAADMLQGTAYAERRKGPPGGGSSTGSVNDNPIPDGLLPLLLLAGGYAFVVVYRKRRKNSRTLLR